LYIGNAVVIWVMEMLLLFVYWECCFYLYIGNAVIIWVVGSCCYLGIGNDVVICVLGMLL
jgi:hypothetical protein